MADINPNLEQAPGDRSHRMYIDYIDRTREHYLAAGYNNPYQWVHYRDVPFTRPMKPLSRCRVGLITTAAEFRPDKGDQGPHAPYNTDAKFHEAYHRPIDPPPDLRIAHIAYDRANTVPADIDAYFPLARLKTFAASGRIGGLAPRFYAAPTLRSARRTIEIDAPMILRWCREDGVDAAVLAAV